MITGYIKGQNLTIRTPMIAADTIDYLTAQFVFQTVDWEGCRLFSHWKCGETNYTIELSDAGKIEKEQHLNLTAGTWTVWIHGEQYRDGELIQRITTDEATLTVKATGTAGGSPFPEVPASDLERINAEIAELQDAKLSPVTADANMTKPVGVTEVGQLMTAPDVFWARYDATKYADIRAAFESGKMCFLRTPNGSFPLINVTDQNASFFGIRYQNDADLYRVTPADVWSRSQYKLVTSYDQTGNINKDALTGKVPTDKAVYDAILKYATGGGTGTDLYGSAMVTIAGPDFDNLAVESIMFPPGVTETKDQNKLLAACAVKCFMVVSASEDDLTAGILDCVECAIDGAIISLSFIGSVVGSDAVTLLAVMTDLESVTAIPQIVSQGGGNGGGSCETGWTEILPETTAVNEDPDAVGVELPGMDVAVGDVCRVYWQGNRYSEVAVVTAVDGELNGIPGVMLTNRVSDEVDPDNPGFTLIYFPDVGGTYAGDSEASAEITVRVEKRGDCVGWEEFEALAGKVAGKVGTTEFETALAKKAGIENSVYVLEEGESLDDVPEGYALVYDPYAEEPEKDYYTKPEIDTMFGSYVSDIAELIGGEAIADS